MDFYIRDNPFTPRTVEWYIEEARNGTEKIMAKVGMDSSLMSDLYQLVNDIQSIGSALRNTKNDN